jgi:hypothetical protein
MIKIQRLINQTRIMQHTINNGLNLYLGTIDEF